MAVISIPIIEFERLKLRAQNAVEVERTNSGLEKTNSDLKRTNSDLEKTNNDLERTNSDLERTNSDLQKTNNELTKSREYLEQEIRILKELLRLERIKKYGRKSERLNEDQLEMLELEPSVEEREIEREAELPEEKKKVAKAPHPGRNELPGHLPREEKIISVKEEKRKCPCCGKERRIISYEEKEELIVKPAQYSVRIIKREKLACPSCPETGVITAAPAADQIIEKGKLSNSVIFDISVKKYGDHIPLYRQQAILQRDHGIEISRSTLNQAVMACGNLLEPVVRAMKKDLLEGEYIQADETPIGVQSEKTIGRNHTGFAFQYSRPGGPVVFDFQMSRAREGPQKFLENYSGILQSDGYAGYKNIGSPKIIRAACMAHVRRKFTDLLKIDPKNEGAGKVLNKITHLYRTEKIARENKLNVEERRQLRQRESLPLMEELKKQLTEITSRGLPSSLLVKAANYALNQWEQLITFLEHGVVEIDQNLCENGMRPLALGRKNWLHIGSEKAGQKIAAILSIFETCKRLKVNIRHYLADVLPQLANRDFLITKVPVLTPHRWLLARSSI